MFKKIAILLLSIVLVTTMSCAAYAGGFAPSVEAKLAPEVVAQVGADGIEYAVIIRDGDGKEVRGVHFEDLIVTPVSRTDEASVEIRDRLVDAYQQLTSIPSLAELDQGLEAIIQEISSDITVDDLVVRDLFDVCVSGMYLDYLSLDGYNITIRFALSADVDAFVTVLHNVEGDMWEALPNDRIVRNEDNTIDVTFDSLGPVAFLFDARKLNVDSGTK